MFTKTCFLSKSTKHTVMFEVPSYTILKQIGSHSSMCNYHNTAKMLTLYKTEISEKVHLHNCKNIPGFARCGIVTASTVIVIDAFAKSAVHAILKKQTFHSEFKPTPNYYKLNVLSSYNF